MITCITSVPRGALASMPEQYESRPMPEKEERGEDESSQGEIPGFPKKLWFTANEEDDGDMDDDEESDDDELDSEDMEDVRLSPTDAIFLVGNASEDGSSVEMHVYDEVGGSLYVHHDVALPGVPLALEWIATSFVAVGTSLATIEVWDLDVLDPLEPTFVLGTRRDDEDEDGGEGAVVSVAWNRIQVDCLAAGDTESTVTLWDLHEQKAACELRRKKGNKRAVQGLAWHPSEATVLATGADNARVAVWDCRVAKSLNLKASSDVQSVAWLDSAKLLAACDDGSLFCFDPRSSKEALWQLEAHSQSCPGVAVTENNVFATASHDKKVKIWKAAESTRTPKLLASKSVAAGKLFDICYDEHSPNLLATAGSKGIVALWDTTEDVAGTATAVQEE